MSDAVYICSRFPVEPQSAMKEQAVPAEMPAMPKSPDCSVDEPSPVDVPVDEPSPVDESFIRASVLDDKPQSYVDEPSFVELTSDEPSVVEDPTSGAEEAFFGASFFTSTVMDIFGIISLFGVAAAPDDPRAVSRLDMFMEVGCEEA
jgi:hypothetical protein